MMAQLVAVALMLARVILAGIRGYATLEPQPRSSEKAPAPRGGGVRGVGAIDDTCNPKVYLLEITGEFGRDIGVKPIRRIAEDIRSEQADVIVVKIDCEFQSHYFDDPDGSDVPFGPAAYEQLQLVR